MNYKYKIMFSEKRHAPESVIEYDDEHYLYTWMTHELKKEEHKFKFSSSKSANESFIRTKKWIMANYPELLL